MNFYDLDQEGRVQFLGTLLDEDVKFDSFSEGLCGYIYIFDQGKNTLPRYVCIKVPKPNDRVSEEEIFSRFVRELKMQVSYYSHQFVHFPFDFNKVLNVPTASFRYWGNDLRKVIVRNEASDISRLSMAVYTCIGLRHCYTKGLIAHQDLKPANIFIRDVKKDFVGLPSLDIYEIAKVADFGLANAFVEYSVFEGARPFMAPEQWKKEPLSQATDVFALGVILYLLLSQGYHPVGIKLYDFWPIPKEGNTKKWTRTRDWERWINADCKIKNEGDGIDGFILEFIERMLHVEDSSRPSMDEVIQFLLSVIQQKSNSSYRQIEFLIDYFDQESSTINFEKDWPYLHNKWKAYEEELGGQ